VLAVALVSSLVCAAAPLKLATVGFSQVGLSDAQAGFYAEHFSTKLSEEPNVRITTPKDMAALLGIEKQKQLLGCSDQSSSCMAELAGALGADGLITGQVAKVGKRFQLNLKVIAGDGSRTLFVHSSKLLASEEDLVEELNSVAGDAIRKVREQLGMREDGSSAASGVSGTGASASAESGSGRSGVKLIPAVVGGVLILGSIVPLVISSMDYGHLSMGNWGNLTPASAQSASNEGKTTVTVGIVAASVGVVALVAGLIWYFLGGGS
jgi:hypothetical protein